MRVGSLTFLKTLPHNPVHRLSVVVDNERVILGCFPDIGNKIVRLNILNLQKIHKIVVLDFR